MKATWMYGFQPNSEESVKFIDSNVIESHYQQYTLLKKIKLWYGKSLSSEEKCLLGFECTYLNFLTGEKKVSPFHGIKNFSDEIIIKEIEINSNDHFNKFNLACDDFITHFKLSSEKGKEIEVGNEDKENEKTLDVNINGNNVIQFFNGFFDSGGIRAIGVNYMSKKDFLFKRLFQLFRVRHFIRNKKETKDIYSLDKEIEQFGLTDKYIVKTCLLPDTAFAVIIKYC